MLLLATVVASLPLTAAPLMDTTQVFHLGEVTVFERQPAFKSNQVSEDFTKTLSSRLTCSVSPKPSTGCQDL